ncbi:MAG: ABC transporter permease [Pseudomonadota bacterium]
MKTTMRRRIPWAALALLAPAALLALAAGLLSDHVTRFGYTEIHPGQALAPPGTRTVPAVRQTWDGEAASFDRLDRDRDGLLRFVTGADGDLRCPELDVAREEWRRHMIALAMARRSGAIPTADRSEELRWTRHHPARLLEADLDGDHAISRAEYPGAPRSRPFLLGADASGRDLATRLSYGARASLLVALLAAAVSLLLGTAAGLTAGMRGGWVDGALMRLADTLYGLPLLFVVMVLSLASRELVLGLPDMTLEQASLLQAGVLFLALGAIQWPTVARLVRGRTVALGATGFVTAARSMGLGPLATARRHVLPHLLAPTLAYGALLVPGLMLEEAFLSFLGFGLQPPYPSFGLLIQEGLEAADRAPLLAMAPMLLLTLTALGAHLLARRMEITDGS